MVAGWSPQPIYVQKAGADRRFGGPLPEVASRAGALLVRALPAPRDPASHPRAAVPIWSHPTVSDSLSGLPLTDARMPRWNLGEPSETNWDCGNLHQCREMTIIPVLSQGHSRHS